MSSALIGDGEGQPNWDVDRKLQSELLGIHSTVKSHDSNGIVVALSGASGFVGQRLLQQFIEQPQVARIHCIAVRSPENLFKMAETSQKVFIHAGDLTLPSLGMTSEAIQQVFSEADIVIHNGALVSFSQSYDDLRSSNIGSTREIARLSLEYNHVSRLHYISTSGLATALSQDIYELPADTTSLNPSRAQGYVLSKLTSELYLEEVSKETGLSVTIHRPTIVIGPDAPRLDVMHSVLHFSGKIAAAPQLSALEGTIQFVDVNNVAIEIAQSAIGTQNPRARIEYLNHYDSEVEVGELGSFVSERYGINVSSIPMKEWIQQAVVEGLAPEIAKFLELVHSHGQKMKLRKLRKGTL